MGELVAGLITGESAMTEMTEDADCVGLDQELVGEVDVVESECDHVYCEKIVSKQEREEVDYVEQESTPEELDKMQYSTENLVCPLAFNVLLVVYKFVELMICY